LTREERNEFIETLYAEYYETLRKYCFSRLGFDSSAKDNVEDCIQAVFEVAVRRADSLIHSPNLGGWLMQTCVYVINDMLRAINKRRTHVTTSIDADEFLQSNAVITEDIINHWVEKNATSSKLNTVLSNLSIKDEEIFHRHFIDGLTLRQIAHDMNISLSSVKATIHRIRKRLKDSDHTITN